MLRYSPTLHTVAFYEQRILNIKFKYYKLKINWGLDGGIFRLEIFQEYKKNFWHQIYKQVQILFDPKALFQCFSPALKSATAWTAKEDRINGKLETTLHCGAFYEADKDKLSA